MPAPILVRSFQEIALRPGCVAVCKYQGNAIALLEQHPDVKRANDALRGYLRRCKKRQERDYFTYQTADSLKTSGVKRKLRQRAA